MSFLILVALPILLLALGLPIFLVLIVSALTCRAPVRS